MSVSRKTAEAFRRHGPGGARKVAEYLRDHHNATRGTIWYEAAAALEQLAEPPDPARTWARSKIVAALKARVAELEAAAREKPTAPDPSLVRSLEAIAARALDLAHDTWSSESWADLGPEGALADELHRAGLFDAEEGTIKPAGEALQLRVARRGAAPDPASGITLTSVELVGCEHCECVHDAPRCAPPPATRQLRVYVAGGSSEVELVARHIAALRTAGVEITYDWTADVLAWRAEVERLRAAYQAAREAEPDPADPNAYNVRLHGAYRALRAAETLTAEQRAAHARADLDGIERADVVWWILPAAPSEGSAFEAGVAHGLRMARPLTGPRLVVSGDRSAHGRVFPELAAERWSTHEAAIAAIVSLAAERRKGGAP